MASDWQNKLYFGDNLEILRGHVGDESVGVLIYTAMVGKKPVLQPASGVLYCPGSTLPLNT